MGVYLIKGIGFFCSVLLWGLSASSSLYCKYSCDTNKGRKAAMEFLSTKKFPYESCLEKCSARELIPFFCEFFSLTFNEETDPLSERSQILMKILMKTAHNEKKPVSWDNNYAYHILKTISPSICIEHQTVISTALSEERQTIVMDTLKRFLSLMNAALKKRYITLKEYWTEKKQRLKELPEVTTCETPLLKKNAVLRLFNWCYNYCSGERAPKTYQDLEDFVMETKGFNPGHLVDQLKSSPSAFSRHKHAYARRIYKCLTQCSLKHTERYLCYLIDDIDLLDKEKGDVPKKMLDIIGQILLMAHISENEGKTGENKLNSYVSDSQYVARCRRTFQDLYYRGHNYQLNVEYLKKSYGAE